MSAMAPPSRRAATARQLTPLVVKDVTTASFAADVIQESRKLPVLVDFWAPWCGPCKQLQPALEKVVAAAGGAVKLVKMNIDEHPAIAGQLGIQSIPAVIAFRNGQPVDGFMGAVPESQIRDFIQKLVGKDGGQPQVAEALAAAEAGARGRRPCRRRPTSTTPCCRSSPTMSRRSPGWRICCSRRETRPAPKRCLPALRPTRQETAAIAAVKTKIKLADEAAKLGDPAVFEHRLAENPGDHQARFDLAMIQNAQGKRQEAADNLLAIVKADRGWNDDGARAQLLKLFEAWGMTDEVTLSARRKLSSLLFS